MNMLHTEEDYRAVLQHISALFDNEPERGTPEGDDFEAIMTLIEAYEAKHFARYSPTKVIKLRLEQSRD